MKRLLSICTLLLLLSACKNDKKDNSENSTIDPRVEALEADSVKTTINENKEVQVKKTKVFPAELQAVFTAHGGLSHWKQMNNLCFEMKGKNGVEIHTVSLLDRKSKIESKDWSIGYDGKKVWLLRHDVGYKGDPVFYHNLMFYFYAMPFVIADPGTNYTALKPTELDGKMYDAYKISYNDGVGDSSKDEYKLYFDPETNKMAWLAYTVTFKDQKKSTDWHFIKYDKWQDVNGLLLPEKLSWYTVENDKPKKKEMDIKFDNIAATETLLDPSVFVKPAEGRYVD
ncbi:DUF6503 family protein [Aequorivita capsosiphonis]|uniref:DUF6503 family protein n=1 Tax=Aequorivita capsosiphonis TaxID=487317 RepID=UPI00040CEB4A|nr:DUF6503 family protein [Aequorivita capsosiphonis]